MKKTRSVRTSKVADFIQIKSHKDVLKKNLFDVYTLTFQFIFD